MNPVAQTFTSGVSGILQGIEVNLTSSIFYPDREYIFQVTTTVNGIPDTSSGAVLATLNGVASDFSSSLATTLPYHYFDVADFNIQIIENDVLAFIFDTTNGPIQINGDMSNSTYEGGSAFIYSNGNWIENYVFDTPTDYSFQTYVSTVPLPGAAIFFFSGLIGLFLVAKKKKNINI